MIRRNDSDDEEPRKWESTWGVDLNKEDIEKLEGVCRLGALGFTMVMDRTLDDTIQSQGLGRASGASMLYTSTPMAASTSRWMQFLVTLIGLGFIIQGVPNMLATSSGDGNSGVLQSWRHFKFLNLADRCACPRRIFLISRLGCRVWIFEPRRQVCLLSKNILDCASCLRNHSLCLVSLSFSHGFGFRV
jgi:hypothetical protein